MSRQGKIIEIHKEDFEKGGYKEFIWYDHRGKENYNKHHDPAKRVTFDRRLWRIMVSDYWAKEWDKQRFKNLKKKMKYDNFTTGTRRTK